MSAPVRSKLAYPRPWKFRIACTALILKWLAGLVLVAGLALGLGLDDRRWLLASLAAVGIFVVLAVLSFILGAELPCNVCRHPLLISKRCRKHVKAKRALGLSYPLGVAVPALLNGRFHCSYCGEKIPLNRHRENLEAAVPAAEVSPGRQAAGLPDAREDPSLPERQ